MKTLFRRLFYALKTLTCGSAGLMIYHAIGVSWDHSAQWTAHLAGLTCGAWVMYETMNGKLWGHITLSNDKH